MSMSNFLDATSGRHCYSRDAHLEMNIIDELKKSLNLKPHPNEGGYFVETYRSTDWIITSNGERSIATAIYYLLTPDSFSALHKLTGDEIFHFYAGDPVEMLMLFPNGSSQIVILGADVIGGMKPQHVVPGGVWQGSRLVQGGRYALLGATMSPGFAYDDYIHGNSAELIVQYPERAEIIQQLISQSS